MRKTGWRKGSVSALTAAALVLFTGAAAFGAEFIREESRAVLQNDNIRLELIEGEEGFGEFQGFVADDGWRLMGESDPLTEIRFLDSAGNRLVREVVPKKVSQLGFVPNGVGCRLSWEWTDGDGVEWEVTLDYVVREGGRAVEADYRLSVDGERELLYFGGPSFLAGEGSFGGDKHEALFPGLEWLESGFPSSGSRTISINRPEHVRTTPHPRRITVPAMAVSAEGRMAALLWDMTGETDGSCFQPSAVFDSPNRLHVEDRLTSLALSEAKENHYPGIFAPSVGAGNVPENRQEATIPLTIGPSAPIILKARLFLTNDDRALPAVGYWLATYGLPELQAYPRSLEEEIELCRLGFDHFWDEEFGGYSAVVGFPPEINRDFAAVQLYDSFTVEDPQIKARLRARVERTFAESVEKYGDGGVIETSHSAIRSVAFPFFAGNLPEAAAYDEAHVRRLLEQQEEDGIWLYHNNPDPNVPDFGIEGDTEVGYCIVQLHTVFQHLPAFGGDDILEAGLRGLDYLDNFMIPRGAHSGEASLYTPGPLSAAGAARCFLYAYRLTGDEKYLEGARKWAESIFPFLYVWQDPALQGGMLYGCTGGWGASWYGECPQCTVWFGLPVQWVGLFAANTLFELDRVDPSPKWRTVAEGMIISAMYQQVDKDGEHPGVYFDLWDLMEEDFRWEIPPAPIQQNVYNIQGRSFDVTTHVVHTAKGAIQLSGVGEIQEPQLSIAGGTLAWGQRYATGEVSYVCLVGISDVDSATAGEVVLQETDDLDAVDCGYLVDKENDRLFLKIEHIHPDTAIRVAFPVSEVLNRRQEFFHAGSRWKATTDADSLLGLIDVTRSN